MGGVRAIAGMAQNFGCVLLNNPDAICLQRLRAGSYPFILKMHLGCFASRNK